MSVTYDLIGQREQRLVKVDELKKLGINPYPAKSGKTNGLKEIKDNFEKFENKTVTLAGRLMAWREHGNIIFGQIQDNDTRLQIFIRSSDLAKTDKTNQTIGFENLNLVDLGDFIEVTGTIVKTKTEEISIIPTKLKMLSKALRPLPDKWKGVTDKELRYRRRYLDFTMNQDNKEIFVRKAKFWSKTREYLQNQGFMEVETPVLEHKTGGADARPFVTHHNDEDINLYLRISTELYQKRLIGAGFEKIYTIGPNFRNEGIDDEHLQEYYQVEWYWAYADYTNNMKLVTDLFRYLAKEVYGTTKFTARGHEFDLADEWTVIDYVKIIKEKLGIDIFKSSDDEMLKVIEKNNIKLPGQITRNRLIDNLWKSIRKDIAGPAFLINEPKFMSPLAKSKVESPEITERFHAIIAGSELGNGYSEINDPVDQLARFREQESARTAGDAESQMLDIDFVEMLEYGMPPTSGWGHSERLFWFLEDISPREGTLFPLMREELDNTTKKIYGIKDEVPPPAKVMKAKPDDSTEVKKSSTGKLPTREEAMVTLEEHVNDPYQLLHAKMVAKAMEMYANKFNEDVDLWYITGLLHDVDYFEFPEKHPDESLVWFKSWGYPEELIDAVKAHGLKEPRIDPTTRLAKTLIAVDELSGLIYAYFLMRPTGFDGMEAKSILKKFKDKAFAAKISREEVSYGVELLGIDFSEHVQNMINVFATMPEIKKV